MGVPHNLLMAALTLPSFADLVGSLPVDAPPSLPQVELLGPSSLAMLSNVIESRATDCSYFGDDTIAQQVAAGTRLPIAVSGKLDPVQRCSYETENRFLQSPICISGFSPDSHLRVFLLERTFGMWIDSSAFLALKRGDERRFPLSMSGVTKLNLPLRVVKHTGNCFALVYIWETVEGVREVFITNTFRLVTNRKETEAVRVDIAV